MILDEGNHLNNTPSHKRNYAGKQNLEKLGKKSSDKNNSANHTSQNQGDTNNRKRALVIGDSISTLNLPFM